MAIQVVGSKMPDLASDQLKPSKRGYGQNGFGGASSDVPGENTRADFQATPKDDPALDRVKASGTRTVRPVNAETLSDVFSRSAVPVHPHMAPNAGSPSGKVAGGLADDQGEPMRKPDCPEC